MQKEGGRGRGGGQGGERQRIIGLKWWVAGMRGGGGGGVLECCMPERAVMVGTKWRAGSGWGGGMTAHATDTLDVAPLQSRGVQSARASFTRGYYEFPS